MPRSSVFIPGKSRETTIPEHDNFLSQVRQEIVHRLWKLD